MSNEFSLAKSGGLGNTPWVNAKISTTTPTVTIEDRLHEERRAPPSDSSHPGIEERARNSLMRSPPRAGTTLLKPTAAK